MDLGMNFSGNWNFPKLLTLLVTIIGNLKFLKMREFEDLLYKLITLNILKLESLNDENISNRVVSHWESFRFLYLLFIIKAKYFIC